MSEHLGMGMGMSGDLGMRMGMVLARRWGVGDGLQETMVPLEQDARMVLNAVFESLFGPNFQRVAMRKLICVTIQVKERNFASASKSRNTVLCQHPSQRDKFALASKSRGQVCVSIQVKEHDVDIQGALIPTVGKREQTAKKSKNESESGPTNENARARDTRAVEMKEKNRINQGTTHRINGTKSSQQAGVWDEESVC
eukprot:1390742-Amorphochlora_amoeboformis.AAC.1